ncbi:MAG: glycosyltransferase family 2 protein [Alphaproteobacteria bacterium]|nr:glycosyltransferase family 2 protein [Alphaproteobacteria bacterium]
MEASRNGRISTMPAVRFAGPAVPGLLSVVVPVGNDPEGLRRTLASLRSARSPAGGVEIVVGNDGADPAASAVAAAYGAGIEEIKPNAGSYAARNRALARTRGEWIGFVDADTMVDPGWMEAGIAALGEADYASGPVVVPQHTATSPGFVLDWLNAFPVERYLRDAHFAPTANLFVRRSLIERLGAFDPRLRSGGDVEFGRRVHAAGLRQIYRPDAITFHLPRSYREQLTKVLRVTRGQYDLQRYHPDLFPEFRLSAAAVLRNLAPPLRLDFMHHAPEELGPRGVRLKPLLYLMKWSFKLQRARAQIERLAGGRAGRAQPAAPEVGGPVAP